MALAAALAGGCGSSSTPASSAPANAASAPSARTEAVAISGYAYHPVELKLARGTKVTFTNRDQTAHTATSTMPVFDTGSIKPGQSRTVTLTRPGTYSFYCQFHPFMRGVVTVTP